MKWRNLKSKHSNENKGDGKQENKVDENRVIRRWKQGNKVDEKQGNKEMKAG